MKLYYSPAYAGSAYSFETTRKATWVAESLRSDGIAGVELVEPRSLTAEQIHEVHSAEYVEAVRTGRPRHLAESQGFTWDEGLWRMVLSSNGGAVAAALAALDEGVAGSLSSGLHHARRETGAGYCTFNGLVLAAHAALSAGASSVLILDFDAHCGGGTASLIASDRRLCQADVAVNSFDYYSQTVHDESGGRISLELVHDATDYLGAVTQALDTAIGAAAVATVAAPTVPTTPAMRPPNHPPFDLCLYNAGMDPHEYSPGGLRGITTEMLAAREHMVMEWAHNQRIPLAFVLAGGYLGLGLDQTALVALHRLTIAAAAEYAAKLSS